MRTQFFKIEGPDKRDRSKLEEIKKNYIELADKDEFWLKTIFNYLFDFYNCNTGKQYCSKSENEIKKIMQDWFCENEEFLSTFTVNFEPRSQETEQEGYDDIKFQNQIWGHGRKCFVIECKNLSEAKRSLDEYIIRTKTKNDRTKYDDGALYRFVINKYAAGQEYGGIIGFVQGGNIRTIMEKLKNNIRDFQLKSGSEKLYGHLIDSNLLEKTISGNSDTFQSNHVRWDKAKDTIIPAIHIYHILFDFTN
ncbi:MAG TPA: hypothetical protein VK469_24630 [Candidatus Kapabacteria bacterium]|nr:hypothetical protein [Candidatus Kapabacteria bacterium]